MAYHSEHRYIPTLDGWRAIAISLVLLSHSSETVGTGGTAEHLGFLGVAVFFGISGYLICTKLLMERQRTQDISLAKFYWRRAFRILPAAVCYLLTIGLLGIWSLAEAKGRDVASGLFLFANYLPNKHWDVNHFWSLSMEEHFYLIWPVSLALLGNRRARNSALAGMAMVCIWRIWVSGHFVLSGIPTLQRTDMRLDAFLAPCVYAILLRTQDWKNIATRWLSPLVCILLLSSLALLRLIPEVGAVGGSLRQTIQACVLPLVIISTVLRPTTLFARFLELPPIRWIGRISYSIYLWQMPFFSGHGWLSVHTRFLPLKITVIFAVAALSYYVIERPMIRLARRSEKKVSVGVMAAAAGANAA
jgi:peptidoglycan/LPS O-acetylase OafA/YrhL